MNVQPAAALELIQTLVTAIELTPAVAVRAVDADGVVTYWNHAAAQLYGVSGEEAIGRRFAFIAVHPDRQQEYDAMLARLFASAATPRVQDWHMERADGEQRWLCMTVFPLIRDGAVRQAVFMELDITGRKAGERELFMAAQVFENCRDPILITDPEYRIVAANPAFTRVTGFSPLDVAGRRAAHFDGGGGEDGFYRQLDLHIERDAHWSGELASRSRDGACLLLAATVTCMCDPDGRRISCMAVLADITERRRREEETRHLAEHDFLTGLPNRVLFLDRLNQTMVAARRKGTQVALLYLDLDRFKEINDGHGHDVGDAVLKETARRLVHCVRGMDTVCRQGGDEFVLLLADIGTAEQAAHVAGSILRAVEGITEACGVEVALSASIGISLFPDDGDAIETLFKHADVAMYHAKQQGRNGFRFFSHAMNAHVVERIAFEGQLRQGVARGEFELEYQPAVDIASGRMTGAEALLRWRHPERGLLLPQDFLSAAEDCGLMVPLGDWVLRAACRQAQGWRASGYPVVVAVNLSPAQFAHPGLLASVEAALAEAQLPPEWLEVEISEAMLLKGAAVLQTLRARGVKVSIDDFGTGLSSLGALRKLAVSKLKIDRSFIGEIGRQADGAPVIPAIIALGHSLAARVVAEGVERADQLLYLRQNGCDEFQGRYADALAQCGPQILVQ